MTEQRETLGVHAETQAALERAKAAGHEPPAVGTRGLVIGMGAMLALMAVALVVLYWMVSLITRLDGSQIAQRSPLEKERELRAQPPVQPNQAFETEQQRQRLTQYLSRTGWINKEAGIAHLSIEQAMEIQAKRLEAQKLEAQKSEGDSNDEEQSDEEAQER